MAMTIEQHEERWKRFGEALAHMHEHPAEPLEKGEARTPDYFAGCRDAVSWAWFQFELASRATGFPEADDAMGPVVTRAAGLAGKGGG